MLMKKNHSFHMVDYSPWPICSSLSVLILMMGLCFWFHNFNYYLFLTGVGLTTFIAFQWWRDVTRESTYQGLHTPHILSSMKIGMILFIVSEIFFFISFFWAFFHSSLSPCLEIGLLWPPTGVDAFDPMQIPLLNTVILLSSGITITWSHHSLLEYNILSAIYGILATIFLGVYFTLLQAFEYFEASFSISDSIYGTTFFVATGFHGLHVIVGSLFLMSSTLRMISMHFSSIHHFHFEGAAWYWHFVDVVWLFLFINMYWMI